MVESAYHSSPVWSSCANTTVQVDLAQYSMPGRSEELNARLREDGLYMICCVPFFVDGIALGDIVKWDERLRTVDLCVPGGHAVLRIATVRQSDDTKYHSFIHAWLRAEGLLHEWRGYGYVAVDIPEDHAVKIPDPLLQRERNGILQISVGEKGDTQNFGDR